MFTRMMELIDMFTLDVYSVRFLPSSIAAAVFTCGNYDAFHFIHFTPQSGLTDA
jgi:hypothetical protein